LSQLNADGIPLPVAEPPFSAAFVLSLSPIPRSIANLPTTRERSPTTSPTFLDTVHYPWRVDTIPLVPPVEISLCAPFLTLFFLLCVSPPFSSFHDVYLPRICYAFPPVFRIPVLLHFPGYSLFLHHSDGYPFAETYRYFPLKNLHCSSQLENCVASCRPIRCVIPRAQSFYPSWFAEYVPLSLSSILIQPLFLFLPKYSSLVQ